MAALASHELARANSARCSAFGVRSVATPLLVSAVPVAVPAGHHRGRSSLHAAERALPFAAAAQFRQGLQTVCRSSPLDDGAVAAAEPPAAALAAAAAAAAAQAASAAYGMATGGKAAGTESGAAADGPTTTSSRSTVDGSASGSASGSGADTSAPPGSAAPNDGNGSSASAGSGSSDGASTATSSTDGNSNKQDGGGNAIGLILSSGAAMLPHPDKVDKGGEDSYFIAEAHACVGVADGVGGWAEIGVDAGAYARMLMKHAKEEAELAAAEGGPISPQVVLERAFYRTDVQGSSTACVLCLNGRTLHASNLGDSGFVIVRGGRSIFQSPQQQHNFNFPYQLGSVDSMSDQPQAAMRFELAIEPGDIIVTGSDGLWDNVFAEEVATIVSKCHSKGESAEVAAQVLARYARMRASDSKYNSPFSYAAIQAGYVYLGGKMDDISTVVSFVKAAPLVGGGAAAAYEGPASKL